MQDYMSDYSQRIARIQQDYDMVCATGIKRRETTKKRFCLRAGCDRRDEKRIVLYLELFIGRRAAVGR